MKKISVIYLWLSLLFLLLTFSTNAQVKFETFSSLETILSKAKKENKLVLIQVESKECGQCNDVAQKGLSDTALKEKYAINFVSILVKQDDGLWKEITNKVNLKSYEMGSLFLDSDGNLILKINSTTSRPMAYLEYADKAIALSKNNLLKDLEARYQKGERSKELLINLIHEKNKIDFDTRLLLEQYLDLLTLKEIRTMETAKLILEQGMPLESRAREVIYAVFPDSKVDSLFLTYPLEERSKMNNKIIASTRQGAIRFKSRDLIYKLSNFISNTHQQNFEKGNFHRQKTLVDFYKEIKDTTSFLQNAENFCNYSLYSVSIDTLKKRNVRERSEMFEQRGKSNGAFSYSPFYLQYGSELNNLSYEFFKHTNDLEKLAKALKWSKRSMEINEALVPDENRKQNPYFMDTYASLLYRLGKKEEAMETQMKALEILKSRGESTANLEITLTKIRNGTL
jgi:hypothetical protein